MGSNLTGSRERIAFVHADEAEAAAIRARAEAAGITVSELCRRTALLPVRMPERAVVVGVESMDATGSALGHAVRGENGLGLRDVPALARRLRDRIMELRIVWTRAPLPEGMYCWQAAEKRIGSDEPKRVHVLGFRCSAVEFRRLRASADACRLPVSAFARMRALGLPPQPAAQPVQGMAAVRRALGLMHHVAMQAPAWDGAIMRLRAEAMEHVWDLRREALS